MVYRGEHDITAAIEAATRRISAYRRARQIYRILLEVEDGMTSFIEPPERQEIKPEETGTIDQGLTVTKPAPPVKPAPQPLAKVQIRGMSSMGSMIRSRLESVRTNMTGLTDDLSSLDKTLSDMRGHVNATHEDIHSDATMLGNSSGNGGKASQELADKLAGDDK